MEVLQFSDRLPGTTAGVREYLIIISPSKAIMKQVDGLKKEFLGKFGTARYIHSPAHISLCHFLMESTPEATLLVELRQFLRNWKSFTVEVSRFGRFSGSNTLFLDLDSSEIVELQHHMVAILRKRVKVPNRFTQKLNNPHITIASDIADRQFDRCWNYFSYRRLRRIKFLAERVTVLSKNHSLNEKRYKVAFEIKLKH